jgi:hypothetical protein
MPKGIPKKGFRRSRKLSEVSQEEIERNLIKRYPDFLDRLEQLTKPFSCPHCGNEVKGPDREALIYLCNRAVGMPKQRSETSITHNIVLSADELDEVFRNHLPQVVEMYRPEIVALLPERTENV